MSINKDSQKAPNLRFKGFTDDWEQRKLGEITTKIGSGKTPKGGSSVYVQAGIVLLRSQNIFDNKVHFDNVVYISTEMDNEMLNSRVEKNDVLLNITGASIGRSAVYEIEAPANVNQHVCIIRPQSFANPVFIQLNLSSDVGQKQIELNQAGGGREGLNFQQISKLAFNYPSLEEQKKIGKFFKNLDDTITLHQRKLDQLNQLKEALLQQMFPGKGETVPKLRFAGFEGDWEELKLSAVVDKQIKGKAQADKLNPGNVEYLDTARLNGGEPFLTDAISNVMKDDILILWDGSKAGTVYIGFEGALGSTLKAYRTNSDSQFVFQYLKRYQEHIYNNYRTPNIPHVQKDFLEVFTIKVPTMKEQTKIGNTLKHLDTTITLQQRKLDQLKNMKQVLLQNMFI